MCGLLGCWSTNVWWVSGGQSPPAQMCGGTRYRVMYYVLQTTPLWAKNKACLLVRGNLKMVPPHIW